MSSERSAEAVIGALTTGAQKALVLRAFVTLGAPDYLGDGEMTLTDLADAVGAPPPSLARLLRTAMALDLCRETVSGRFELTDAGRLLRRGAVGDAAGWVELMTAPWMLDAWGQLGKAIQADNTRFADVHGMGFWEFVAEHPAEAGVFDQAMTSGAHDRAQDLLNSLDWSSVRLAVDVGGGQGRLLALVLAQQPQLHGIVIDRPEVVVATPAAEVAPVADRLEMRGGSFFDAVPEHAQVYVLSRIVHDWPDRDAIEILLTCRRAMSPEARLCLLEHVAPEVSEIPTENRSALAMKDLNMLVLVGGQERTLSEYQRLLEAAGLAIEGTHEGEACTVIHAVVRR